MPELPLISSDELKNFLAPFTQIPLFSGIETELHVSLQVDVAVGLFQRSYYVVRLFPALTDESAEKLKTEYAAKIEAMASKGMDISSLPVSLEQMRARNTREFNAFPIWRLDPVLPNLQSITGYTLTALRFMPDPVLSVPCIMLSYEKDGARSVDVLLHTMAINPRVNAVLAKMQAVSEEQAAVSSVESLEAQGSLETPTEERSEGGIILPR